MNEVLVLAEHRQGALCDAPFELLTQASALATPAGQPVACALLGHQCEPMAQSLSAWADTVLLSDAPELRDYNADAYLVALDALCRARKPALVLLAHSAAGMDLAPALAARLGAALATDCLEARRADAGLELVRHLYGGKVHEQLRLQASRTPLMTIRPGAVTAGAAPDKSATIEPVAAVDWTACRGRELLGYLEAETEDVDIGAASILVSVGRGLGGPDNLPAVEAFARAIGATLSCSRPVADKGWLPKSRQVGTSGRVVRPKLYIALGISGAYQHVAGISGAETIIAVNRDPAAPIFDVAHYGIVADLLEVLPLLQERLLPR